MMKKILLLTFLSVFGLSSYAQHQADHWYFGTLAGLDFSSGTPVAVSGSVNSSEGTASVSSASGDLMFYTDGVYVWDSTDAVMPNGAGLMGDISSTQSAIIVPSPTSQSQFYIFTTAADGGSAGLRYSTVDMTLNGGLGDVTTTKNISLTDSVTEKLCAIKDAEGTGYWIMAHIWGTNEFYAYHLTGAGIAPPVISAVGSVHTAGGGLAFQNTYGQMKFNMCGDKLALAMGYLNTAELFSFNNFTGVVSNPMSFPLGYHVYGVEFSKSSDLLYVTSYDPISTLNQFNITLGSASAIAASRVPISATPDLYALQMGPDGKIYVAESFTSPFIGVINNPDTYGFGANFVDNAIQVDPGGMGAMCGLGFPSFLQDYLKINVTCSSVGLDEKNNPETFRVYPNPGNEFTLQLFENTPVHVTVYDPAGRIIEERDANGNFSFGRNYAEGVYFISLRNAKENRMLRVVKN
jgi:hypothetical protein